MMNVEGLIRQLRNGIGADYLFSGGSAYLKVTDIVNIVRKHQEDTIPTIPDFVAEHIEWAQDMELNLIGALGASNQDEELSAWLYGDNDNQELFAIAWTHSYKVGPKYEVVRDGHSFLGTNKGAPEWGLKGEGLLYRKKDAEYLAELLGGEIRLKEFLNT